MPDTDVPTGFYRIPARCGCGTEHLVLSIRPGAAGEVRDRKCDRCAAAAETEPARPLEAPPARPRVVQTTLELEVHR